MKTRTLRVALAQINPTMGNLKSNVAKIVAAIRRAGELGTDLVACPELSVCGYPPEDLLLKPQFLRDCRSALDGVIAATRGIVAVVGFPDKTDGHAYNAAAIACGGTLAGIYHKIELPNYGVFDEKRYFARGAGGMILDLDGARVAVTICEDIWLPEGQCLRHARRNGADAVLNISASPFHAGKEDVRMKVLTDFGRLTHAFMCYSNLVGGQDELIFDGGSMIVAPNGTLVASAKRFEEDLLVADVSVGQTSQRALTIPEPLPGEAYLELAPHGVANRPALSARCVPALTRVEEVYKALVLGTRDYTQKNGFRKTVLGLSGGVDSSLTAAIAVDALGTENVVGVTMPSRYTSEGTRNDAELLAANLNIRFLTVPIEEVFSAYLSTLKEILGPGEIGLAAENLQARVRGNILMALSNKFGWLVLTTGNKSEIAVGYCTLYGDMAGGFSVIKDVPKTLVYQLSEHVNRLWGREAIPRSVFDRPPTAELRPNQKDEDSLPPYAVLDCILESYVERDLTPEEIVRSGFDARLARGVARMVDLAEYKRRQAPPGVKITPKAFGKDRRLPITNLYGRDEKRP